MHVFEILHTAVHLLPVKTVPECIMMICSVCVVKERAADDSKEVEGFQQLLLARTQVHSEILSTGSD